MVYRGTMGFRTWLREDIETRAEEYPLRLDDGTFASWMGWGRTAGVAVSPQASLGLTAVYRAVSIIAGTIAGLPLKTYRDEPDGTRQRIRSFLDNPAGPDGLTQFEWTELILVHLLLWGDAFLAHQYGAAGQLIGLIPMHPTAVEVRAVTTKEEERKYFPFLKYFHVTLNDGSTKDLTPLEVTHIPALGIDGLKGLGPVETGRQAVATGLAGDRAAANMFESGLMVAALVTSEDDLPAAEAQAIKADLDERMAGTKNAGKIAFINRVLKVQQLANTAEDSQFLESRVHQVEEIARLFGVPPHLLGQTEKATSWGTGITEQNRGLARFTLMAWTSRIEQRLSRLLPNKQFCEFDYAGLVQGSAQEELQMLIDQVGAGILTVDEARAIRNLPPLTAPVAADNEIEASDG